MDSLGISKQLAVVGKKAKNSVDDLIESVKTDKTMSGEQKIDTLAMLVTDFTRENVK